MNTSHIGAPRLEGEDPVARRAMLAGITGIAAGALLARGAVAGPLNPPPGPVAPTPGPEPRIAINATNTPGDATSVFRISQPGSYYLTDNVTGEPGKNAITIATGGVSVDLMGYSIRGVPGSLSGITAPAPAIGISIVNGFVTGFSETGINLRDGQVKAGCRVSDVTASMNGLAGIQVGNESVLTRCTAVSNPFGIVVDRGCVVESCTASSNGTGILALSEGVVFIRCTVRRSTESGLTAGPESRVSDCSFGDNATFGAQLSDSAVVAGCSFSGNGTFGLRVGTGSLVSGCVARSNGTVGIRCDLRSSVIDCVAQGNSVGIEVAQSCRVSGCTSTENTDGIVVSGVGISLTTVVETCSCTDNTASGVSATAGGNHLIRDNFFARNGAHGVSVFDNCQIVGNRFGENGAAASGGGVVVAGTGNLINNNTFVNNQTYAWRLAATSTNCTVYANTFRGPGSSVLGSGHAVAPIQSAATALAGSSPFVNIIA